ncbi:MAG: (Fe-S)-binding protein [Candidatus Sumerlaeia bacterium]
MTTATQPGACSTWDLTLDTLFDTPEGRRILSCIQCGTCVGTCPYGEHMEYPPRLMIQMMRAGRFDEVLASDSVLRCVACYACMVKCPRDIRLTETILRLVKEEALARQQLPAELQAALQNTMRYGNPLGESPRKRAEWTKALDFPVRILAQDPRPADVLWFVDCYPSYHPRNQNTARATARLFHALGVDFAILGPEERCAGECAQLETGLFDLLRDKNMATFRKYRFRRLVTGGAHAFDAFRNIYPRHGFDFPLDHTVTFFAAHLDRLKTMLGRTLDYTVTYHDSCCVSRHNNLYEPPRALLRAIPGLKLVEMTHCLSNSLCCGGGGGGMWMDTYYKEKGMERLSERRVREAAATGADVLAVSCPYEISRFEDAIKTLGLDGRLIVRDVTELLAEALGGN